MDNRRDRHTRILARLRAGRAVLVVGASMGREWKSPDPLPESLLALGRIPAPIWTTQAGDVVERAVAAGSPPGWPGPRVAFADRGERPEPRRHVLRLLGDAAIDR